MNRDSENATCAVETAISTMENISCLNAGLFVMPIPLPHCEVHDSAGYGSNLTLEGTVECDAALMDGRTGDFGSVGAVAGKNRVQSLRDWWLTSIPRSQESDQIGAFGSSIFQET
jgi:taspase, threonine aspartase, 1